MTSLYRKDFHAWSFEQAAALEKGDISFLDFQNLAEEIRSMGRHEEQKLTSCLRIIFMHLLKFIYQPEKRTSSWIRSIRRERMEYEEILQENPSLTNSETYKRCIDLAYKHARKRAAFETHLDIKTFPEEMPFTVEDALREDWMPE